MSDSVPKDICLRIGNFSPHYIEGGNNCATKEHRDSRPISDPSSSKDLGNRQGSQRRPTPIAQDILLEVVQLRRTVPWWDFGNIGTMQARELLLAWTVVRAGRKVRVPSGPAGSHLAPIPTGTGPTV